MTCIVGLIGDDGSVYMGGDTATTSGWDRDTTILPKVFYNGEMLIGGTGAVRLLQLLEHALHVPYHPEGMSIEKYLVTIFVDAVRECFKQSGLAEKESDREKYYGSFLIGYRGHLASFDGSYGMLQTDVLYNCVGSGEAYAKGSLYTSEGLMYSSERRIELALEAASKFAFGVGAPFHILKLNPYNPTVITIERAEPETAPETKDNETEAA